MKVIREGDLYFLESPFHFKPPTEESTALEKRLSYLLGTVSARPAVVIRGPSWWDKFNTVTVLPALTKGRPAIAYRLYDVYGHQTGATYPFVPHNPHTIPVSRLGKYIGSLDPQELEELLYAFKWIHDPFMQADPNIEVPEVYRDVMEKDAPSSWHKNRDARAKVDLFIDKNSMKIRSRNFPSLDGFPLGDALKTPINADVTHEMDTDIGYVATTNPLPDATEATESVEEQVFGFIRDIDPDEEPLEDAVVETPKAEEVENPEPPVEEESVGFIRDEEPPARPVAQVVPVERDFPPSTFPVEMLREVAGRFDFSAAYYDNTMPTRDPKYLTEEEIRGLRGNMTDAELRVLFEDYRHYTPMDAFILGPRLPTDALQKITGYSRQKTAAMKRLCNVMRDIDPDDYEARIAAEQVVAAQMAAEKEAAKQAAKEKRAADKKEQAKLLELVRPYLSPARIYDMTTEEVVQAFVDLPMGVVKRAWVGTNFKDMYTEAKAFYKKGLKLYAQAKAEIGDRDFTQEDLTAVLKKLFAAQ